MKSLKKTTTFYCFSPPVMVFTFLIEIALAILVFFKYERDKKALVIVSLLILLGAFQIAEYHVCTISDVAELASRLGFVAITFLPPLGLFLMFLLTGYKHATYIKLLFFLAFVISVYFMFAPQAFESYQCTGNYVIFQIGSRVTLMYQIYYFGLLAQSILTGIFFLNSNKTLKTTRSVKWLLVGYAFFIVPVAILTLFHPDTSKAIPSILCGFAVTLALVLALKVAPSSLYKK